MITFACPRCQQQIQTGDGLVGKKVCCKGCGQRLQVPQPPRSELPTIMGQLLPVPTAQSNAMPPAEKPAKTIRCVCPHCQAVIKAPSKAAGTRTACPRCGLKVEIPVPKAELYEEVPPVPADEPQRQRQLVEVPATGKNNLHRWYIQETDPDNQREAYGPFTLSKLQEFVTEGRLVADDLVCKEGFDDWVPAYTVMGELLSPPATDKTKPILIGAEVVEDDESVPATSSTSLAKPRMGASGKRTDIIARIVSYATVLVVIASVVWALGWVLGWIGAPGSATQKSAKQHISTKRLTESEAIAKLRQVLNTWVSNGPVVTSNTRFPGIEFEDTDLGSGFILLHYAMGHAFASEEGYTIHVQMNFRLKDGGEINLLRVYQVGHPNERGASRIFVVTSELGPRIRPN